MDASHQKPGDDFDVLAALERIAHWLPSQGPIKDFVHHNTLHEFQRWPFHEAILAASELYGAASFLDLQCYRDAYQSQRISESALSRVLDSRAASEADRKLLREQMFDGPEISVIPDGIAKAGIRSRWSQRNLNLDVLTRPTLFKLVSNYLDQGISAWRMPHATDDFWNCVRRVVHESWLPLFPLSSEPCRALLSKTPSEVIQICLKRLVGSPSHYERYLLEMLLAHSGWSGMVKIIEKNPSSVLEARKISLEAVVALELTLEYGWLSRKLGPEFAPLIKDGESLDALPWEKKRESSLTQKIQVAWHEAFEWTLYEDVLSALTKHPPEEIAGSPLAQVFFCLDDRAGSLRRHLEETEPTIETLGTAGFFGIDFLYQGVRDSHPVPYCPVAITPRHLVREQAVGDYPLPRAPLAELLHVQEASNTMVRGWLITQTLGLWHSLTLALQVFWPSARRSEDKTLSQVESPSQLQLLRESNEVTSDGFLLGYSIPEMAERIFGVLRSTGLARNFSNLVVILGHGSSSANNPHFAAYNCSACSGKPGGPNARAFAWMANHPEVRKELRMRGIVIPTTTVFLAGIQDTSREEVRYFDLESLPLTHHADFETFRTAMEQALARNAKERCRRFELVDPKLTPEQALLTVRRRSLSIFEPRPELNHATNALAIVGRRHLTRGLFLDRRAFLSSYDPEQDPEGEILTTILEAVVPVCGGINLEYFFSRVDNAVYGAGTKLPHNVVSLIGVSNGLEGDLRTGLPSQMTEVHDPVRLLLVVDQAPEITLRAAWKSPSVFEWIKNQWIRLACLDPKTRNAYVWEGETFVLRQLGSKPIPSAPDSASITEGKRDNIRVHEIREVRT